MKVALLGYDLPKAETRKSIEALAAAIREAVRMRVEGINRVTVVHYTGPLSINPFDKVKYRKELANLELAIDEAEDTGIVIVTGAKDSRLSAPVLVSVAEGHGNIVVVGTVDSVLTTYLAYPGDSSNQTTFAARGRRAESGRKDR